MHKGEGANEVAGSATLLVMNGMRFIAADFGGYKVVVCKNGAATQIGRQNKTKKGRSFISGAYSAIQLFYGTIIHVLFATFYQFINWYVKATIESLTCSKNNLMCYVEQVCCD